MSQTSTRGAWKQGAIRFFVARLPVRLKRLVHLASLGARFEGTTAFDDASLKKLNTIMALGHSDQALKLPVFLSSVIWDGRVQKIDLAPEAPFMVSPEAIEQMTTHCAQATPKWLRYGEDGQIQRDVEKLLSVLRDQPEVHTTA